MNKETPPTDPMGGVTSYSKEPRQSDTTPSARHTVADEPDLGIYEPEWDDFDARAEMDADAARFEARYGGDDA